jgi:hypothetical protein
MSEPTTRQRLLQGAITKYGIEKVAKALNSPQHLIEVWMSGFGTMPDRKLLELMNWLDTQDGRPV